MTRLLLGAAIFMVSALVVTRTVRYLAVASPLRRINYRGLNVPTAAGIAVVVAMFVATAVMTVLWLIFDTGYLLQTRAEVQLFAIAAAGFALLGLWDDIAGGDEQRGWRAHVAAVRHMRATSGAIKIIGGTAFALSLMGRQSLFWAIAGAIVVALSANAFNLLDVRPGRAGKWFLIAMVAVSFIPGRSLPALASAAGAALAFMPFDLRERAMLGDTGAMALGSMAGVAFVLSGHTVTIVVLIVLALMHIVADKPGLSAVIDAAPPLRMFDRAGRVPE